LNRQVIAHEFVRLRRVFRKFAPFGSRFWAYAVLDLELLRGMRHADGVMHGEDDL
jgi:hypothetical protein